MGYSPTTHTLADVIRRVQRAFGDESEDQLEIQDIKDWCNDAQRDIADRERNLKAKATILSVGGQASYRWPAENILYIDSIHYDGQKVDNMSFAQFEVEHFNEDQQVQTGQRPRLWYEWAGEFTFFPAPQDGIEITLLYTRAPMPVNVPVDTLGVPDKYFDTLCNFVLRKAYELDEDWSAVAVKTQEYTESMQALSDEERTAQNMTYGTITEVIHY